MKKKEIKKEAKQETSNNNSKNYKEIEVIFGDESVLNISEVKDCMNAMKPNSSKKNLPKNVIIPLAKKNTVNKKSDENKQHKSTPEKSKKH